MFKTLIAVISLAAASVCYAQDTTPAPTAPVKRAPIEASGSLALAQNAGGTSGTGSIDVEFPLGPLVAVGPVLSATFVHPKGGGSSTTEQIGGTFVFNTTRTHNGLYFSATASTLAGGDYRGYTVTPEVGVKIGNDKVAVRAGVSHPFHYQVGASPVDLAGTAAGSAVVFRF